MQKHLYLIRHGTAKHNVFYPIIGDYAFYGKENIDTKLEPSGIKEAKKLGQCWKMKDNIELVVVSPLSRTLQTASHIFHNTSIPIIAHELLREWPQGGHTCNKRADKSHLEKTFPQIDFSQLNSDTDNIWCNEIESLSNLQNRCNQMKKWLTLRSENNIAIVGHNSYFNTFLYNIKDESEEVHLKHCYPYPYTYTYNL